MRSTRFLHILFSTWLLLIGVATGLAQTPQRSLDKETLTERANEGDYDYGLEPLPEAPKEAGDGLDFRWWKILMYGSVAVALIALVILILRRTVLFRSNPTLRDEPTLDLQTQDIRTLDTQSLINQAKSKGDYRLAVRLLFLDRLKHLSKVGLIDWQPHKTNYDYLRELERKNLSESFQKLTLAYEYVWYGEFNPGPTQFASLEQQFQGFPERR